MHPILFKIFNIPIYSFGFFVALGFLCATMSGIEISKRFKILAVDFIDLSIWMLISGIVGARLLYIIINFQYFYKNPLELIMLNHGGLVYYGGFIGAVTAFILFYRTKKIAPLIMGDIICTALPVGQMFGRIGCFLNGCCFGKPTTSPLRVTYPINSYPFMHYHEFQPIHPVQLYESFGTGIIFLILISIIEQKKFNGQIIFLYGMLYGILRFCLEFFRGDVPRFAGEFTMSQFISIFVIIVSIVLYIVFNKKSKKS